MSVAVGVKVGVLVWVGVRVDVGVRVNVGEGVSVPLGVGVSVGSNFVGVGEGSSVALEGAEVTTGRSTGISVRGRI